MNDDDTSQPALVIQTWCGPAYHPVRILSTAGLRAHVEVQAPVTLPGGKEAAKGAHLDVPRRAIHQVPLGTPLASSEFIGRP
jgi:hypothetical protein